MLGQVSWDRLRGEKIKILEPACGLCQFLRAIREGKYVKVENVELVGVEIRREIVDFATRKGLSKGIKIVNGDYLLWSCDEKFDLIVGNPPYFIPSHSKDDEMKRKERKYRSLFETWYGKYNIYGAFIEKSVRLLKSGGGLVFVVPATFMLLDSFKKLRKFLAENGEIKIIYVGRSAFRPHADVSVVVLKFVKGKKKNFVSLYEKKGNNIFKIREINSWTGKPITFKTHLTDVVENTCSYKLGDVFRISISPRSGDLKRNPFVVKSSKPIAGFIPILNSKNITQQGIAYEPRSGYWVRADRKTTLRWYFDRPHIVMTMGFREGRRIIFAYDSRAYPWTGDVYHLIKKENAPQGFSLSDGKIVRYLNSEIVRKYILDAFRDITFHISLAHIRLIPIPKSEAELRELERKTGLNANL